MGAREKLNSAYVAGGLVTAAAFGVATESWTIFIIVLILIVVANLYEGNLR